ncbi:cytochrome o ubiquinol oxidase subunit III [Pseudomonas sp. FSL R10-0399]|uniref:cytochrome c oxidase subunit 3 n=1 Tax=Pseudomonas sp. FSL R10-0399 TaxID=2662194 RepID=UPI001296E38B|nr:cytochrome c oxidase subunit 3 [Pseudomonas sp. FSL R10-0399]MQT59794.1 cytochrome o ubiquinol oxidase subunit III [Pseudomonas sp. FSL R10-0399]
MNAPHSLHPGVNLDVTDRESHAKASEVIFGFWIFLMSDLVLFAALFATYAAMSSQGIAHGPTPAEVFDLGSAFIETLLLLLSSFTFGFAILAMKYSTSRARLLGWLGLTAVLGAAFVGFELHDYYVMIETHDAWPQTSGFLSAYYLLTGTHAVHVSAGILWMIVLAVQVMTLGVNTPVKLRLLRLALFWHMLDIVWVGIFTFVYLFGVAT